MRYKRGVLAVLVVFIILSLSMFPVINGDVESICIKNMNNELDMDDEFIDLIKEKFEEYRLNNNCGCGEVTIFREKFCNFLIYILIIVLFSAQILFDPNLFHFSNENMEELVYNIISAIVKGIENIWYMFCSESNILSY
jgi:hypothetical protein